MPVPNVLRVVLVRHADAGVPSPGRPDGDRALVPAGEAAARRLAQFAILDRATGFYAGLERRMVASIQPAASDRGRQVVVMPALSEGAAGTWLPGDAFRETACRYFTEPGSAAAPGWEPAADVARRFGAQVDALRAANPPDRNGDRVIPGVVVVATGGRAAVAFLAERLQWPGGDAFATWSRLRLPDVAVLDLPIDGAPELVIPFGTLPV